MKKILFLVIIIINIFGIYTVTLNNDIYYLSLGDYLALGINQNNIVKNGYNDYIKTYLNGKNKLKYFNDSFIVSNYRSTDLINDINDNKMINNISIQNALIKADVTSISIGNNEIIFDIQSNGNNLNDIIRDIDELFSLIRKYTKEEVIVNSFYYPFGTRVSTIEERIIRGNEMLKELCDKYDFIYNDIYSLIKGNSLSIYPSDSEYNKIGKSIVNNSMLNRL